MKKRIPFLELASIHQPIVSELTDKFAEVLREGIFSAGKEVAMFEDRVKDLLKLSSAIACSNGTDALELALKVMDIGPGDEVIVPALTWISTAEAVVHVGAKPVFCDVDEAGLIAVSEAEQLISPKTKAIIPVHLYGKMADMVQVMELAHRYGLKVIEDAAQAFGAFQAGRSAGTFGDIGCFSFYPTKNLGALGEAGMLTASGEGMEKKLRMLLNHGQSSRDVHELIGRNSKIDSLQAGFLNVKLRYFTQWQATRKKLASIYLQELEEIKDICLPQGILEADHNAHLFVIQGDDRDALKEHLEERGIGTAIHYPKPLPLTEAFLSPTPFPMAEKISKSTLSLPLHPYLKKEEVRRICVEVKDFVSTRTNFS